MASILYCTQGLPFGFLIELSVELDFIIVLTWKITQYILLIGMFIVSINRS